MNLHTCAEFGPDRTTGGDVYTPRRIHTQTDTHTLSYIDIDDLKKNKIKKKKKNRTRKNRAKLS